MKIIIVSAWVGVLGVVLVLGVWVNGGPQIAPAALTPATLPTELLGVDRNGNLTVTTEAAQ